MNFFKYMTLISCLSLLPGLDAYAIEIPKIFKDTTSAKANVTKYLPTINGEMKARYEYTSGNTGRFNVRNARLRFNGYLHDKISYRFFLDFNDNGNITILDTYLSIRPGQFEIVFGQQRADLDRSLNPYFFANRSYLIKYMTMTYAQSYDNTISANLQGWRDIGLQANYTAKNFPLKVAAGVFSGGGMSNPVWDKKLSYAFRCEIGKKMDGLQFHAWYYNGYLAPMKQNIQKEDGTISETRYRQKMQMGATGLYYTDRRMYVEGEVGLREIDRYARIKGMELMTVGYIQGIYAFHLKKRNSFFKYIAPAGRWDIASNIPFMNENDSTLGMFSGHRMTLGINLGLEERIMFSELRINYEKVFSRNAIPDIGTNRLFQDKLTLELCIQW